MLPPAIAEPFGLLMFAAILVLLMAGFPVALTIAGTGVVFAAIGYFLGIFDFHLISALPLRMVDLMYNDLLQAVPLFIYLGVVLQQTTIASDMLNGLAGLFGNRAGGYSIATLIVGALLAPMTGVIGATVLTIGLLTLPSMLEAGYDHRLASGIVASAGSLGTILPPSIILIVLGDAMLGALAGARERTGQSAVTLMTESDLFLGSVLPVALLFGFYLLIAVLVAWFAPQRCPAIRMPADARPTLARLLVSLVAPMALIVIMLGVIVAGLAYVVEAAAIGSVGATLLALWRRELTFRRMAKVVQSVAKLTGMVFMLLIGASMFSLVFRGFEGDLFVAHLLVGVPGGTFGAIAVVMLIIFVLGFFLDALEIILLVVPVAMPPLLVLGADPVWLSVLTAVNLHTSFLTPPFGFALFFTRSIAPAEVTTLEIYRGVLPFIAVHVLVLALLWTNPALVTLLPELANAAPAVQSGGPAAVTAPFNLPSTPYGKSKSQEP